MAEINATCSRDLLLTTYTFNLTFVSFVQSAIVLLERFRQYIQDHRLFDAHQRLLLAVSGGIDSVVLTDLCHAAGFDFEIAHCNFQLRGEESMRDEAFVGTLAARYRRKWHLKRFDTQVFAKAEKMSTEEAARTLRYAWFEELLQQHEDDRPPDLILTAHHADDNIETLLMHFFRGTGLHGLTGIAPLRGRIARPLLFAARSDIEAYQRLKRLDFVEDSSNKDEQFTRNYFRHQLIPSLQKVFPAVENSLLENMQRFREAEILYEQALDDHKKKLIQRHGNEVHLPVRKLRLATPLQTILFEILKEYGFTPAQVPGALSLMQSESGHYICSATHRLLRNREWLILSPLNTEEASNILVEEEAEEVVFPQGRLFLRREKGMPARLQQDASVAQLDAKNIRYPLLLRPWKQGDYFYPLGMQKKKKLSRFFIDRKLSLAEKEKIWVLESDKRILWVIGQRIDDRFKVNAHTTDILRVRWKS